MALGLAVPHLDRVANGARHRQAGDGHRLASPWLPVVLDLDSQLRIELRGNLAAMLTAAQKTRRSPETGDLLMPVTVCCGGPHTQHLEFCWTAA